MRNVKTIGMLLGLGLVTVSTVCASVSVAKPASCSMRSGYHAYANYYPSSKAVYGSIRAKNSFQVVSVLIDGKEYAVAHSYAYSKDSKITATSISRGVNGYKLGQVVALTVTLKSGDCKITKKTRSKLVSRTA